jgi:hypothetical protein
MAVPQERNAITYCSVTTLRMRGWTPFLIRALLGEPDRTVPVELYLTSRVAEAERRPDFLEARAVRPREPRGFRDRLDHPRLVVGEHHGGKASVVANRRKGTG